LGKIKESPHREKQENHWGKETQEKGNTMARNLSSESVLSEAKMLLEFMRKHPEFTLKDLSATTLAASILEMERREEALQRHRQEEIALLNDRNTQLKVLREASTRTRSGVKGYFGADSNEYEEVGGTRSSERKKPVRKTPTT
jgi:hypothetical protein